MLIYNFVCIIQAVIVSVFECGGVGVGGLSVFEEKHTNRKKGRKMKGAIGKGVEERQGEERREEGYGESRREKRRAQIEGSGRSNIL